jgi:hypothetical protein
MVDRLKVRLGFGYAKACICGDLDRLHVDRVFDGPPASRSRLGGLPREWPTEWPDRQLNQLTETSPEKSRFTEPAAVSQPFAASQQPRPPKRLLYHPDSVLLRCGARPTTNEMAKRPPPNRVVLPQIGLQPSSCPTSWAAAIDWMHKLLALSSPEERSRV